MFHELCFIIRNKQNIDINHVMDIAENLAAHYRYEHINLPSYNIQNLYESDEGCVTDRCHMP